ncbi:cyclic nucleotide-binding domain-containing protein 1 isoform X2 [Narcine bancroftii]|uniref:cyclic nucleotide-binding domain-containing protein 1 isoform X2 n=1 Tax=Narcine bancroftii TaxID=1343680 RepID=UPI0038321FDF
METTSRWQLVERKMSVRASGAGSKSTSALIPGMQYFLGIDYDNLQKLCNISGLQNRDNPQSTPKAHHEFLQHYQNIFIQPKPVLPKIPELARPTKKSNKHKSEKDNHGHLEKLQSKRYMDSIPHHFRSKVKTLMAILSKLSYFRTRSDHLITYKILRVFPAINMRFTDQELKKLSEQLIMESWKRGCIVFGYQAFYMILKGCARPYAMLGDKLSCNHPHTWLDPSQKLLYFGDSFGSLLPIQNDTGHKVLSVLTETNCELIKISLGQFEFVKKEIVMHNYALKEELIQACPFYQKWPKLSLSQLAELIVWKKFPKDYVLVNEGEISSFVGYLKSGQCYIFKDIEGLVKLPHGKARSEVKHIVMGKLGEKESFGEISILLKKPFTCTIITATEVELGVISDQDLLELDLVNQMLLQQTAEPILGNLTLEEVNNRFIFLEKEKKWKKYKKKVIMETILYRGIKPGTGKWSRIQNRDVHSKANLLPGL